MEAMKDLPAVGLLRGQAPEQQAVTPQGPQRHLLVPICKPGHALPAAHYAKSLAQQGFFVRISLLFVAPEVETMRQYDSSSIAPVEERHAQILLAQAAAHATDAGISCETLVRYGNVEFTVLDIAEQVGCHEIVVAATGFAFIPGFLLNSLGHRLARYRRNIPVVQINRLGVPTRISRIDFALAAEDVARSPA